MLGSHISMSFFAGMAFSFRYIPLYIALRREKYRERIMKILFREILSQDFIVFYRYHLIYTGYFVDLTSRAGTGFGCCSTVANS